MSRITLQIYRRDISCSSVLPEESVLNCSTVLQSPAACRLSLLVRRNSRTYNCQFVKIN
jgi:hypothetical protein